MSVNTDYSSYSTASSSSSSSSSSTSGSGSSSLSSVDFLTLLVAQLTHQDPLNPTEDLDFTAQLAQLQALDEQMAMTKAMTALRSDMQVQSGTNMIGKTITGTNSFGTEVSGTVTKVVQAADGVFVELDNGQQVPVTNVINIVSPDESKGIDVATSMNAIGMWVEAGYDSANQPIKGIVENISVSNGTVYLNLYGGKSVSWDQVTLMRSPTDDDLWYALPDSVREKVESAQGMIHLTVSGTDANGKAVTGIVADAELNNSEVYLILFDGTRINIDDVTGEAAMPTVADVERDLIGLYATGYDEKMNKVEGVITGAEQHSDGLRVILEDGSYIYYDSLSDISEKKAEDTSESGTDSDTNTTDTDED